jgi:hypothetical protein
MNRSNSAGFRNCCVTALLPCRPQAGGERAGLGKRLPGDLGRGRPQNQGGGAASAEERIRVHEECARW